MTHNPEVAPLDSKLLLAVIIALFREQVSSSGEAGAAARSADVVELLTTSG
jgi:hypothetical protein